ncbi:MAG: phosphate transport system protein [Phycisphaerales bacterium]|jgi:phosphate transport system protein|nr:phosphate transport system protein [Phycisphaerales bacterium]MEA2734591.1 phosphate transport system protein [Humisphaera sp.]
MRHFEELLQELLQKIVMMGTIAESMIQIAVTGLVKRNQSNAVEVFLKEQEVNRLQVEVDDRAVKLTALQQPVAQDVRFLFMASRIGGELERIADQAINIVQNSKHVLEDPPVRPLVELPIMADVAQKMVRDSLTAMIQRDVNLAATVLEEEKKVDAFRNQIFSRLLEEMKQDPTAIERSLSLILIARNLERIGDHATNVAEEVIYWIQGRDVRHSKGTTKAI